MIGTELIKIIKELGEEKPVLMNIDYYISEIKEADVTDYKNDKTNLDEDVIILREY